jgi:hypothetical protein
MKNIEEIQAELRERQIPVRLSSDHRRVRWQTPSCREQRRRYHQDQHQIATGRMCSNHDCTQMEIVLTSLTIARRSKANLMLRMCLLSSLRKENKQSGGQKAVDGFSVRYAQVYNCQLWHFIRVKQAWHHWAGATVPSRQ